MTEFPAGSGAVYSDLRSWTSNFGMVAPGGGTTVFTLSPPHFKPSWPRIDNIRPVVDGMGIRVVIAAGGNVNSEVVAIGSAVQYLTSFTAGAGATASYFHNNLAIPLDPSQSDVLAYFAVRGTFAAADAVFISLLGHFDVPTLISEPQEVTVKGVEFFKKPAKRGPV